MKGINTHTRTALMCDAMYIKKRRNLFVPGMCPRTWEKYSEALA